MKEEMSDGSGDLAVAWGVLVTVVTIVVAAYVAVTESIWIGVLGGVALWILLGEYLIIRDFGGHWHEGK